MNDPKTAALEQKRKKHLEELEERLLSAIDKPGKLENEVCYKLLYLRGHRVDQIDRRIRKALIEEVKE